MWYRLFQFIFFLIWGLTLIYLIFLSCFTLIIFNVCLTIYLFWFSLTLIGWSIALIPILKFVFIPYYRRLCHLWTKNNQLSRLSVAFFHPYCNNKSGNERVLWTTIESLLKKYKHDIQIIIYTGDHDTTSEEILQSVKQYFDIDFEVYRSSITFIYLRSRFLLEEKNYKILSLLGSNIGSIIVGFEALIRFIPDIYIDFMGYTFTYPCFYYLASIPIISYVHHSIIRSDRLNRVTEQYATTFMSKITLIYYQIFTYIYVWCGSCSELIYCNSSWTKKQLDSCCIQVIYPPCDIKQFLDLPLIDKDEQKVKSIVSIGQFRLEKNHQLQIRAFHQLLQGKPEYRQKLKLILIGSTRDDQDREYIEELKILIDNLNLKNEVELKLNISFKELKTQLNQAMIGLHTMKNEDFGIGIVEMMAAGLIVLAHKSGSSKMDIIEEGQTGFFAGDIDSYATMMEQIFAMTDDARHQIQKQARDSVDRFNRLNFERLFLKSFNQICQINSFVFDD